MPADAQDKRAVVHVEPSDWEAWLEAGDGAARAILHTQSSGFYSRGDATSTDAFQTSLL